MDRDKLLDRIRRLLRLSESDNVHEAASAAARAQELMARYRIEAAALDTGGSEDIRDHRDEPLDASKRLRPWKTHLADAVARANGCRIYLHSRGAMRAVVLVGRAEDADLVRVLFPLLVKRVEAMTRKHGAGRDRAFCNAFRLGMVMTIAERLEGAGEEARRHALEGGLLDDDLAPDTRMTTQTTSLALAKLEAREEAVERFMDRELKLEKGKGRGLRADAEGYALGRIIGRDISLHSESEPRK
jgi:hypothetical protein